MTRRRALPGRQDVTNLNSGLNEVECEAADLVCKVAGDGLAVLHDLAVQIELGTALRQVIDGTIHVVAADGDVRFCSEKHPLHVLKPCKIRAETVHLLYDK